MITDKEDALLIEAAKLLGFWMQPNGDMLLVNVDGSKQKSMQIPCSHHVETAQRVIVELIRKMYENA